MLGRLARLHVCAQLAVRVAPPPRVGAEAGRLRPTSQPARLHLHEQTTCNLRAYMYMCCGSHTHASCAALGAVFAGWAALPPAVAAAQEKKDSNKRESERESARSTGSTQL
jgi:hypothetical protein